MPRSSSSRPPAEPERPLRRDAERNRQRILKGARECFAARGLSVSLDDIARHSEVGVGTVYRRFPDKQQLIDLLFEEAVDRAAEILERGASNPDPWAGLVEALEGMLEMQTADRGLMQLIIGGLGGGDAVVRSRERLQRRLEALTDRAQAQGTLRGDLRHQDLALVHMMLGTLIDATRDVEPEVWRRFLGIVLDGLRTSRTEPSGLDRPALSVAAVDQTMERWILPKG